MYVDLRNCFLIHLPALKMCIIDNKGGAEHSTASSSTNLMSSFEPPCDSHSQPDDGELTGDVGEGECKAAQVNDVRARVFVFFPLGRNCRVVVESLHCRDSCVSRNNLAMFK